MKGKDTMLHKYEVHTWTLCDGWINCWTATDPDGKEMLDSFPTIEEAQAEIAELIADGVAEIAEGLRGEGEGFSPDDYRIFDRETAEYVG